MPRLFYDDEKRNVGRWIGFGSASTSGEIRDLSQFVSPFVFVSSRPQVDFEVQDNMAMAVVPNRQRVTNKKQQAFRHFPPEGGCSEGLDAFRFFLNSVLFLFSCSRCSFVFMLL